MRKLSRPSPWWNPAPDSPLHALKGRVLTHLNTYGAQRFGTLATLVDQRRGGLVLTGRYAPQRIAELRGNGFTAPLAMDVAAYGNAYATWCAPFAYRDGLHPVSLDQALDAQRERGADIAITPTLLLESGDLDSLVSVLNATAKLDRDDTLCLLPLEADWLRPSAYPKLSKALRMIPVPTAIVLAADRDPLDVPGAPQRLRELFDDHPGICLLRTDLAAFEAVARGAAFSSIGVTSSHRHGWIPTDASDRRGVRPPHVYIDELFRWTDPRLLGTMLANTAAPQCKCHVCDGRRYDTFAKNTAETRLAAERHALACWGRLLIELRDEVAPPYRKDWWRNKCHDSVAAYSRWSRRWRSTSELKIPAALRFWATNNP